MYTGSGGQGGALTLKEVESLSVANSVFSGNVISNSGGTLVGKGGAIWLETANIASFSVLTNVIFRDNAVDGAGGAMFVSDTPILNFTTVLFIDNRLTGTGIDSSHGYAVDFEGLNFPCIVRFRNVTARRNTNIGSSGQSGGGVFAAGRGAVQTGILVEDSNFYGNTHRASVSSTEGSGVFYLTVKFESFCFEKLLNFLFSSRAHAVKSPWEAEVFVITRWMSLQQTFRRFKTLLR